MQDWRRDIELLADMFSRNMADDFKNLMIKANNILPKEGEEELVMRNRLWQLNVFMHYLIGTTVNLAICYMSDEEAVEELIIADIKNKFKVLREKKEKKLHIL